MRTVKQKSLLLNPVKQTPFNDLSQAYAYEKDHWLNVLKDWKWQAFLDNPRKIRDTFVHEKYQSRNKLQARQWKLALDDVVDTWDGYWQSLFVQIRRKISYCKTFTSEEKHYAYWMLKGYQQFAEMMQGILPKSNFSINEENKRHVVNYIQRSLKAIKKKSPSVKRTNIVKFDSSCYSVFE
ncbi:MAG: hypothetical protein HGB12_17550, partial [Bacteroidetes bacterium]|nr:hypothetical protein [Bacteroidota bacterium]